MAQLPIADLLVQADFGRTILNRRTILFASAYRLILTLLTTLLLVAHLPLVAPSLVLLSATALYVLYSILKHIAWHRATSWPTERLSYKRRAQIVIGLLTLLLGMLVVEGRSIGMLWLLYLPPLLTLSRHEEYQRTYLFHVVGICVLVSLFRSIALLGVALPFWERVSEIVTPACALALASFVVHTQARVTHTARYGAATRNQIVQELLIQAIFATDSAMIWRAIRTACHRSVSADSSAIYLVETGKPALLDQSEQPMPPGATSELLARALREQRIVEVCENRNICTLAVPLYAQHDRTHPPLAVVLLRYQIITIQQGRVLLSFIDDLIEQIWPVISYASMRQHLPLISSSSQDRMHSLQVAEVMHTTLDVVCERLGFSYAFISLVDGHRREIVAREGRNVPPNWIRDSRHPLDSHDIQADVLRTGKVEVIGEWDERFDPQIWETYGHNELVRVWVPLDTLGTIEAGFSKSEHKTIPPILIDMLRLYAQEVTVAVRNALLYQRTVEQATILARLHDVSLMLYTESGQTAPEQLLERISQAALDMLQADLVILYPIEWRMNQAQRIRMFGQPIIAGHLIEEHKPLKAPDVHATIVGSIADSAMPRYCSDIPQFVHAAEEEPGKPSKQRTFAQRQKLRSLAGVPLLASGELLGVLCINYRTRHEFGDADQQVIELFAHHAAAVLAGTQLVREQERRKLEYDLHDAVKSSVRGLILLSRAASDTLYQNPQQSSILLHEVRRTGWGILGDIDLILHDLSGGRFDHRALEHYIHEEIHRLVGKRPTTVAIELDEQLPALNMPTTRALLYILRESLINAIEHANAQQIQVSLQHINDYARLAVVDNGCGFNLQTQPTTDHRGMAAMQERAHSVGAILTIQAQVGSGTQIVCEFPYKEDGDDSG